MKPNFRAIAGAVVSLPSCRAGRRVRPTPARRELQHSGSQRALERVDGVPSASIMLHSLESLYCIPSHMGAERWLRGKTECMKEAE